MKIKDLTALLEQTAPLRLQEDYDNAGLIVGDPQAEIRGALFCLDSTEAVVEEAVRLGCNLVVAHHPIVFRGLKKINGKNYVERTVIAAIRNDVAIYAIHTNLDNVLKNGVNERIAQRLGLTNLEVLSPKTDLIGMADEMPPNPQPKTQNSKLTVGAGVIGDLAAPVGEREFLVSIKERMVAGIIRHTRLLGRPVKRVAVCGGSGSFLLGDAIAAGADVFVTADFKYHDFFNADGKTVIADIGHFESEQFTIDLLYELCAMNFDTFALHLTKTRTNPVFYV